MLSNRYLSVFALGITLVLILSSARLSQAATINVPVDQPTITGSVERGLDTPQHQLRRRRQFIGSGTLGPELPGNIVGLMLASVVPSSFC